MLILSSNVGFWKIGVMVLIGTVRRSQRGMGYQDGGVAQVLRARRAWWWEQLRRLPARGARQIEAKGAALTVLAADPDVTAELLDDTLDN